MLCWNSGHFTTPLYAFSVCCACTSVCSQNSQSLLRLKSYQNPINACLYLYSHHPFSCNPKRAHSEPAIAITSGNGIVLKSVARDAEKCESDGAGERKHKKSGLKKQTKGETDEMLIFHLEYVRVWCTEGNGVMFR